MTDHELDDIYTLLCDTMTRIGPERSEQFLARFALLACIAIDQPSQLRAMIEDAERALPT